MMALTLTPPVFAILTHLVEERCGIHYDLADLELIADRVGQRVVDKGFDSFLDYYYFLKYDAAGSQELDALIETLTVHETYFFRESDQLHVLVDTVLAPAVAAGERPRVWCAACATGEEPLTLAMLLAERKLLSSVEIVASDISQRALDRARAGSFAGRSLRALPAEVIGRWVDGSAAQVRVRSALSESIRWERINLVDAPAVSALGLFDVILCRNVLIYFTDQTARRVVETLGRALRPSGQLLVGVSESLLRFGTSFRCEERGGAFFYQKVGS
jgi:chemotaxis protein methyltransferase CheR